MAKRRSKKRSKTVLHATNGRNVAALEKPWPIVFNEALKENDTPIGVEGPTIVVEEEE